MIIGGAAKRSWKLVNMPFQPEYPGNRQWNLGAAQYTYKPVDLKDDAQPHHPHWDMILKHCGQDLDGALKDLEWAQNASIRSGADYLLHWAACMLREPYEKLPYLFFWGDQNSGKSIYHEALALLMTSGVAAADRALTNANDFNGELANAVLAVVEEKDISLSPGAYNKLKDWVTSPKLWVRKMRTDAYSQVNTLHFVQTANGREACTIKMGDTRITMFFVPLLMPGQEIPKTILVERLKAEAPHFMRTVMDLQLPPMFGRLRLPVVNTDNKARAEQSAQSPLETFIAERCFEVSGEMILFTEFFETFQAWMKEEDIEDRGQWSGRTKVARALPHKFPYGVRHSNQRYVGNLSWENKKPEPDAQPLVVRDNKLRPKGD
jgi:phage/plasmid-associated DNA primase